MLQQLPEEALDICFAYLDLATLARLAACNQWQETYCRQYAERNASRLLVESVALAAERPHRSSAVAWLLALAPQTALTTAAGELLRIPCVPLEVAKVLCENGLKVTFPQVAASAAAGVAGAEVWCKASSMPLTSQQDDNGVSGVSRIRDAQSTRVHLRTLSAAEKPFHVPHCRKEEVRSVQYCLDWLRISESIAHEVDLQELPVLLQIANNMGQPRGAYNLLGYICGRTSQFRAESAAMPQISEASFVEQLLKVALIRRSDCTDYQAESILCRLLQLPGATHLSMETTLGILQVAVQRRISKRVLIYLKDVPAVTSVFDKDATMQLLLGAVNHHNIDMLDFLCRSPAIKPLTADDIGAVRLEASEHRLNGILPMLLELQLSKL